MQLLQLEEAYPQATHKLPTSTHSHVIIAKGFKISAFHCYRLGFEELWYVDEDCEEETGEDVEQGAMLLMLQTVVRSGKFFEINNNNGGHLFHKFAQAFRLFSNSGDLGDGDPPGGQDLLSSLHYLQV